MKKKDIVFLFVLIITVFGLYWKTFNYDFIWDDNVYFKQSFLFTENKPLSEAFKIGYFREQLGLTHVDFYYRPLLTLSFMVENKLWGLNPITLRLINLFIYSLSLIFLFILLKHQSEKNFFPEIATAIFALFPLNVDNIVWIVGRGDLLVLLWGILSILFLEFSLEKRKGYYLIYSSLFFLFGIFSKESTLFFLPVLVIYELVKRKKLTWIYHIANILFVFFYFTLKNTVLGIKNVGILIPPSLLDILKSAVAALGYFFRSIIFPLKYDMFLPVSDVLNIIYFLSGISAVLLIIYLISRTKKDKELILPLSLIIIFIGGHLLLLFTQLFPFKLYSRYMMIPALGAVWILSKYICKLKENIRLPVVFILLLAFIPSIILNASAFRSDLDFWGRAHHSSPNNGYILFQIANAYNEKKEYMSAELYLNRTLALSIRKETAILVSLLYSDIEFQKSDYEKVYKWLNSIEELEKSPNIQLAPFIKFHINYKKAQIYISQGNIAAAEKLLQENIQRYKNIKESYSELYSMYLGFNQWEKAEKIEEQMKFLFPAAYKNMNSAQTREEFNSFPKEKKIGYYIQYKNFAAALSLIESLPSLDFEHQLLILKIHYWLGNEEEGQKAADRLFEQNSDNPEHLNRIGLTFLNDLYRAQEALTYFKKSLEIDKNQPEIVYLVTYLANEYLNKLTPVWKEE